jgi:ABC-type transport system involved in multi-copper enzyme maturation permease subunit
MGRAFLSLFNPGPGAGYLFAVANLTMVILVALAMLGITSGTSANEKVVYFLILAWSYVVAFLGFGRLIIYSLRRWVYVPMAAAFLLHLVLAFAAIMVPLVIQLSSRELRNSDYSLLQITNPLWTLTELSEGGVSAVNGEILIWIIPAAAFAALMLNMRSVATELLYHRIAPPVRVAEDEIELHPAPAAKPSSPWEVDEATP